MEAIDRFVCATELVNSLGLFSSNEELDEVPTTELRYLLLPALLGDLFIQQMSQDRLNQLNISKVYFIDFLKRCKNYGVTGLDVSRYTGNSQARHSETLEFHHLLNSREEKIARYKELRGQEEKLKELKSILDVHNAQDEENKRKYFKLLLKTWVNKAVNHLASIHSETNVLEHMEKLKRNEGDTQRPEKSPVTTKGVKTVLITRENVKKEVFGAGYSSVPTASLEDFVKEETEERKVVLEYKYPQTSVGKQEEKSDEEDDPGKLKKARDWDDWKDDHRRGWGNRDNMG